MPRSGKSVSEGVIIPKSFPGVKQESRGVGIAVEIRHGLRLIVDVVHRALSKEELGTRQHSRNFFVLLLLRSDASYRVERPCYTHSFHTEILDRIY